MSVRLYGRDVGNGSLATVSRGFALALGDSLSGFVAIDRRGGSEEAEEPPGALAHDGVFVANLNQVALMRQGARHERHWVQVTPNSTHIPPRLLAPVLQLPRVTILSCSAWGTGVIGASLQRLGWLVREEPSGTDAGPMLSATHAAHRPVRVLTVRHGVAGLAPSPEDQALAREAYERGAFRAVHFSTSEGERKGTLELLVAWERLQEQRAWQGAELHVVLDYPARQALEERLLDHSRALPPGATLVPRADLSPAAMARFLGSCHVLVAPSRGEGFGLLPLEARASGCPVVATGVTGHSAGHVQGPGVVIVATEEQLSPIDDGPGALAPRVEPAAIAAALQQARDHWRDLSAAAERGAPAVAAQWSWPAQLQPLLAVLADPAW